MELSIIIPARNEEEQIGKCLQAIKAAAESLDRELSYEVVVVLNRCTDGTEIIAKEWGCRIVQNDAKNLSAIRNEGAWAATGEVLVTVDADSQMSSNMLSEIFQALYKKNAIGGGVPILPERYSVGILVTGLCLLPIALRHMISGGLFFCRSEDFWAIDGFDERLASVEDIDFAKRLRRYGKSQKKPFRILWRTHIRTSMRKFDRFGDWYFVLRPWLFLSLLKGRNQAAADKVWYDFER